VRVLVLEDDEEVAEAIGIGLRRADMAVDLAFEGRAGLELALMGVYDVVVLDRDLPGLHGDVVCARLMEAGSRSRVLMLTAAAAIADRVDGLALGADDYLTKPFALAELVARVRALTRRSYPPVPPTLVCGNLEVDTARHEVRRGGEPLLLRPKEFGVLEALISSGGRLLSADELLDRVWDDTSDPGSVVVKMTVSRLRRKLGDPPLIETVGTLGYRMAR